MVQTMNDDHTLIENIEGNGESGVHIRADESSMPTTVATFDGERRISEWKAALQRDDEVWFAKGYLEGLKR
jgi:hypothetical protein